MKRATAFVGLVLFLVLVALSSAPANGNTFLSRPPVNGERCSISDAGYVYPSGLVGQETAAQFVVPTATSLVEIRWWGAYGAALDPTADDFVLQLFADASGYPADTPLVEFDPTSVTRTSTSLTAVPFGGHDGGTVYAYDYILPQAYQLTAGTKYYLSVLNDTNSRWGWLFDGNGSNWYRDLTFDVWQTSTVSKSTAFELATPEVTVVPEPATLGYLVLGSAILAWRRRRARRAA